MLRLRARFNGPGSPRISFISPEDEVTSELNTIYFFGKIHCLQLERQIQLVFHSLERTIDAWNPATLAYIATEVRVVESYDLHKEISLPGELHLFYAYVNSRRGGGCILVTATSSAMFPMFLFPSATDTGLLNVGKSQKSYLTKCVTGNLKRADT